MNGVFVCYALLQGLMLEIGGSYAKSRDPKSKTASLILACGYITILLTLGYIVLMAILNMTN